MVLYGHEGTERYLSLLGFREGVKAERTTTSYYTWPPTAFGHGEANEWSTLNTHRSVYVQWSSGQRDDGRLSIDSRLDVPIDMRPVAGVTAGKYNGHLTKRECGDAIHLPGTVKRLQLVLEMSCRYKRYAHFRAFWSTKVIKHLHPTCSAYCAFGVLRWWCQ